MVLGSRSTRISVYIEKNSFIQGHKKKNFLYIVYIILLVTVVTLDVDALLSTMYLSQDLSQPPFLACDSCDSCLDYIL